ncbi:hypothetical protein S245_058632, partial [Arachis hypogaea]
TRELKHRSVVMDREKLNKLAQDKIEKKNECSRGAYLGRWGAEEHDKVGDLEEREKLCVTKKIELEVRIDELALEKKISEKSKKAIVMKCWLKDLIELLNRP